MYNKGPKIIAEIGQNHNGCLSNAIRLVDMAYEAGCYAVKTAKRDVNSFPEDWKSKPYTNKNSYGATYYEHRKALELNKDDFAELKAYTNSKGMLFGSSFTDKASLDYLYDISADFLKIASSRVVDHALLVRSNKMHLPVFLSSGMSTIDQVEDAISTLRDVPYLALFQCTSCYPTHLQDLNLNVLRTYRQYALPIGLSCHSQWYYSVLIAMSLGAEWFEFHITEDRNQKGTDHAFSLERQELLAMDKLIKAGVMAMGSGEKTLLECEKPYAAKLRDDLRGGTLNVI